VENLEDPKDLVADLIKNSYVKEMATKFLTDGATEMDELGNININMKSFCLYTHMCTDRITDALKHRHYLTSNL
jgi:hypothetical protein